MSMLPRHRDGHYDEHGNWKRTKLCFVDCGDRCTCRPPFDVWTRIDIEPGDSPRNRELHEAGKCLWTCALCYATANHYDAVEPTEAGRAALTQARREGW